jgi:HEAT repeat protein
MKQKASGSSNEPISGGKRLSHWLRRIDVAAADTDHQLAYAALREIGPQAIPFLIEGLRKGGRDAQRAARAFEVLGVEAASAVAEIQADPGPEPTFAGSALAGIGAPAFEALSSFLTHHAPMVRSAGAEGIKNGLINKRFTSEQAQSCLRQLVRNTCDPHPHVRARSASAVGLVCTDPALCVPALIENLDDHSDLVRSSAANALGPFGKAASAALPKLLILAGSLDGPSRCRSVEAIAKIGLQEGYEVVVAALDDKDITVRNAALNGLGYFPDRAADVIPRLVHILEGEPSSCKWNALWALGRLGPLAKDALPAIRKWETRPNEVGGEATLRRAIEQIEGREPPATSKPI